MLGIYVFERLAPGFELFSLLEIFVSSSYLRLTISFELNFSMFIGMFKASFRYFSLSNLTPN